MTKAEKVRILLLTLDSHLPDPKPPRVYASAEPGPQASYYVRCGTCKGCGRLVGADEPCVTCLSALKDGRGIRRPRHGCRLCLACDGRGERYREPGEEGYDPYSGKSMKELGEEPMQEARSELSVRRVGLRDERNERGFGWERMRLRNDERGSYNELRQQLEWLRDRHIARYETLMHWISSHDDKWWSWSDQAQASVDGTILLLADRMPEAVRVPKWVRQEAA